MRRRLVLASYQPTACWPLCELQPRASSGIVSTRSGNVPTLPPYRPMPRASRPMIVREVLRPVQRCRLRGDRGPRLTAGTARERCWDLQSAACSRGYSVPWVPPQRQTMWLRCGGWLRSLRALLSCAEGLLRRILGLRCGRLPGQPSSSHAGLFTGLFIGLFIGLFLVDNVAVRSCPALLSVPRPFIIDLPRSFAGPLCVGLLPNYLFVSLLMLVSSLFGCCMHANSTCAHTSMRVSRGTCEFAPCECGPRVLTCVRCCASPCACILLLRGVLV